MLHVNPDHLIIGNGATELIVLINTTLIDRIAVPVPTFGEYIEKLKDQRDAELYPLESRERLQARTWRTISPGCTTRGLKSLLIINPGNPTGQLFSLDEMIDFLHQAKDLELVIVDESFIDFAGDPVPSLLHVADRFSNLLLVRSMSKHCGVPGLRLGYCYSGNLYVLNRMRQFIPTWNVNTLAQYFLVAAARHRRRLSRRAQAPDRRRPLALRIAARDSRNRGLSHRREFCSVQDRRRHDRRRTSGAAADEITSCMCATARTRSAWTSSTFASLRRAAKKTPGWSRRSRACSDETPGGRRRGHPQDHPQEQVTSITSAKLIWSCWSAWRLLPLMVPVVEGARACLPDYDDTHVTACCWSRAKTSSRSASRPREETSNTWKKRIR